PMLQRALVSGLLATGCEVVELNIASTPAVAFMVRRHGAAGGVVITASHNPVIWNGIKFLTDEGLAPPPDRAQSIFETYRTKAFKLAGVDALRAPAVDKSADEAHVEAALGIIYPDQIAEKRYRVVLDSINGAGSTEGKLLLSRLGCEVIHVNAEPNGRFAHTPEPTAENLTSLCEAVRKHKAHIGFAQDPDADRLAIVDEHGNYIGEEYTLALCAMYMFKAHPGPIAANLSTSRMVDDLAAAAGGPCRVVRSAVGEANVVAAMRANGCRFGGEGNGGVIDPRVGPVRDSLVGMALTLQLMAIRNAGISQLVEKIPRYVMSKQKFECSSDRIARVLAAVRSAYAQEKINDIDGVRIDFAEGWVHVRGSNTEPIIRIIAEAKTQADCDRLVADVRRIADGV
ncbi:MAG TPA: phosphoglucosamine mutase, partial [Phycisphaerae bacterium]|nr:phosphoglucosamine mutase [Phycisphaerae bacterium]